MTFAPDHAVNEAGAAAQKLGGLLRCRTCGKQRPLGDVSSKLAHGWPTCCGHTMEWITQRQLDAGDDHRPECDA